MALLSVYTPEIVCRRATLVSDNFAGEHSGTVHITFPSDDSGIWVKLEFADLKGDRRCAVEVPKVRFLKGAPAEDGLEGLWGNFITAAKLGKIKRIFLRDAPKPQVFEGCSVMLYRSAVPQPWPLAADVKCTADLSVTISLDDTRRILLDLPSAAVIKSIRDYLWVTLADPVDINVAKAPSREP